jgi:hypothetical protein
MILITAPVFGDLTSLNEQLPEIVRVARGATVSRIRIELIFRRCWNQVTPYGQHCTAGETARAPMRWRRSTGPMTARRGGTHGRAPVAWESSAQGGGLDPASVGLQGMKYLATLPSP